MEPSPPSGLAHRGRRGGAGGVSNPQAATTRTQSRNVDMGRQLGSPPLASAGESPEHNDERGEEDREGDREHE